MCVVYDYVCVVYVLRGKTPRAKTSLFFFASTAIHIHVRRETPKPADLLMHVVDERMNHIRAPRRSVESAPAHGRTHSRAMALVLRGARAAGVLKQVTTAPLAQVRPRGSRGPRCRRHRRVRSRSRAQPVCSYDRVSVDARLTPRPTPTRTQANAARGASARLEILKTTHR